MVRIQELTKKKTLAAEKMNRTAWRGLAIFLFTAFGVAAVGAMVTASSLGQWYFSLTKPIWTPPESFFGPIWTALYLSMAVAAWRVWMKRDQFEIKPAMVFYHLQLAANLLWSVFFFGLHNPALALGDIVALQFFNIATAATFFRIDRIAGLLLLPYLVWVSFATVLNCYIWVAN